MVAQSYWTLSWMSSPVEWATPVVVGWAIERWSPPALWPCVLHRSGWVINHPMCTRIFRTTASCHRGHDAHPLIQTRNRHLYLSFCSSSPGVHNLSFGTLGCPCITHNVPGGTSCASAIAPLSFGHGLSSVDMRRSDRVTILQLSVVTSYNWYCHRSTSSSKSMV